MWRLGRAPPAVEGDLPGVLRVLESLDGSELIVCGRAWCAVFQGGT